MSLSDQAVTWWASTSCWGTSLFWYIKYYRQAVSCKTVKQLVEVFHVLHRLLETLDIVLRELFAHVLHQAHIWYFLVPLRLVYLLQQYYQLLYYFQALVANLLPHLDEPHQEASEVDLLGISQQAIDIFALAWMLPIQWAFLLPHVVEGGEYLVQFVFVNDGWKYLEIVHHLSKFSES